MVRRYHSQRCLVEDLEIRCLLASVTLNVSTTYQAIDGFGTHLNADSSLTNQNLLNAYVNAGFNMVRLEVGPSLYTPNNGGDLSIPVPIDTDYAANIARFDFAHGGWSYLDDAIKWIQQNSMDPSRFRLSGAVWSPPHWLKIGTGTLINWTNWDGTARSDYGPFFPYGVTGGNTGGGRVDPAHYQDVARWILSFVKGYSQYLGIPIDSFSFQNEPDYEGFYNTCSYGRVAKNINDLTQGYTTDWTLYASAFKAITDELALHPEITTKMIGPEIMTVASWANGNSDAVRTALVNQGLMSKLSIVGAHGYEGVSDSASGWNTFWNRYSQDGKPIYATESSGENQSWMDTTSSVGSGALGLALKIHNALTYGHASTYEYWSFSNSTAGSSLVQPANLATPTIDYKYDAMIQFSRFIRPGAQRIGATFENGMSEIGGANSLDSANALNVSSFYHPTDKRLTTVLVNMRATADTATITLPAGLNINSFDVYTTDPSNKFVRQTNVLATAGKVTITVPAHSVVTVTGIPLLPEGWSQNDIGSPAKAGTSNESTGTWSVSGAGTDIAGTTDQFQFASEDLWGNGTMIARVTSVQNTNSSAKAGIMIRNGLAANASYAAVVQRPDNTVRMQWRSTDGGTTNTSTWVGGTTSVKYVKLVRSATGFNSFSGYYSTDGATWTQIGSAVTISIGNTAKVGLAVTSRSTTTLCSATFTNVSVAIVNTAPTVATPAAASPATAGGTTTGLSVLGADDYGESGLTYTWSMVSGPAAPIFSINGTNAAKGTTVTFVAAGIYTFMVTIMDAGRLSTTSSVGVTVLQTLSGVSIAPGSVSLGAGVARQFTATAVDQFGNAMGLQPVFVWSAPNGSGSISAAGIYTAPDTAGTATIRATSGSLTQTASVTITDKVVSYAFDEASGAAAADQSGNGKTATLAAGATFGPGLSGNALQARAAGCAVLPAMFLDGVTNFTVATWVKLNSQQTWARVFDFGAGTASYMMLTPNSDAGKTQFEVRLNNGSKQTLAVPSAIPLGVWTHVAVTLSGTTAVLYINGVAVATNSNMTIRPTDLGATQNYLGDSQWSNDPYLDGAIDNFRVYGRALSAAEVVGLAKPSVVTPARATPSPVAGTTAALSVLGADDAGEASLSYTWSVTSGPAAVSFSANGTSAAKIATATFTKAGTYSLLVTITNPAGLSVTSALSLTVNQTLSSISITPDNASVPQNARQQYAASGLDQFGQAMLVAPAFTWSATGGEIDATGLYTAGLTLGAFSVSASAAGITGSCAVNVTDGTPAQLVSAVSRRSHGAAGSFDISLNLSGPAAVEDRVGGPALILVNFDEPVVLGSSFVLTLSSGTGQATVTGSTLSISMSGASDVQMLAIGLNDLSDASGNLGSYRLYLAVLMGDVNGSGSATSSDIALVKSASSLGTDASNFRLDVNCSGAITTTDIALVKSRSSLGLPLAIPASSLLSSVSADPTTTNPLLA